MPATLLACGINHQTASRALRDQLVFPAENIFQPLANFVKYTHSSEAAILSTCNRTEFYCVGTEPLTILEWLEQEKKLPSAKLKKSLYIHQGDAALRHILRVASGLDSIIVGETQIAHQVKKAFSLAATAGTLGKQLKHLAQYVFSVNKQVRTETAIGEHPVSLGSAIVNLAKHIFADLTQTTVLIVGAGEMSQLVANSLQAINVSRFIVANRTKTKSEKLAQQLKATSIHLSEINQYLLQADIVVTATAHPALIIGKGMVESALKTRKHRPIFMADLSVPRNIEPEISQLADVYLSTIEDLQYIVAQNLQNRQAAAKQAEMIIETQVQNYAQHLKILEAAPVITAFRNKVANVCDNELSKALQQLQNGTAPEQVLNRFAHDFMNKLLHDPSLKLRQAAYQQREDILALAKWLLVDQERDGV